MKGCDTVTIDNIKQHLNSSSYQFLKDNHLLGSNIFLLTLGGSHAYGMNTPDSDIDIRGIAFNPKSDILLATDFEQVVDVDTDTTIYSFRKMMQLLTSCNPNTLEILGCLPEHYIYLTDIGRELIENRHMFLSQLCAHTFSGYATSQLRRMENKSARKADQPTQESNILKSINNAYYDFMQRYQEVDGLINLYVDDAVNSSLDKEIFMDVNLKKYPLRDYAGMLSEMQAVIRSYDKNSSRNEKAAAHDKLGKHQAHLIRLLLMGRDILEKEEIITYRECDHDLLMSIRNGNYLDSNDQPIKEFYELVNDCEQQFEYALKNTSLPLKSNKDRIQEFQMYVNERVVRGDI